MSDFQIFFLIAMPIVLMVMCGLILISARLEQYDDSNNGPVIQDTFEEMSDADD